MRFREYSLALFQIMLSIVVVSIASPAPAQFREIAPDKSDSINADGELVPTREASECAYASVCWPGPALLLATSNA